MIRINLNFCIYRGFSFQTPPYTNRYSMKLVFIFAFALSALFCLLATTSPSKSTLPFNAFKTGHPVKENASGTYALYSSIHSHLYRLRVQNARHSKTASSERRCAYACERSCTACGIQRHGYPCNYPFTLIHLGYGFRMRIILKLMHYNGDRSVQAFKTGRQALPKANAPGTFYQSIHAPLGIRNHTIQCKEVEEGFYDMRLLFGSAFMTPHAAPSLTPWAAVFNHMH